MAEPRALSPEQYMIGRLPWIETTRSEAPREGEFGVDSSQNSRLKFARVDLNLIPREFQHDFEGVLADNGIVATRPPSGGYLQVPLGETSGKNLDALRLAAVEWKTSPTNGQVLVADGNQLHSQEFLDKSQFSKVNTENVLQGLKQLHARYGIEVNIQSEASVTPLSPEVSTSQIAKLGGAGVTPLHLEVSADQAAKLAVVRSMPINLDNLPYDHQVEEAKARQLAEAKPTTAGRAVAGAAFGVVASIPAMMETYNIGEQEVANGKAPIGAATYATKYAAEAVVGGTAAGATAVAATPLLAIPPPVGEIAYGAAVLGAGYLGAEGTRQLMAQADYYTAKAKAYFQDDKAQASFEGQIRENANKNGQNPDVAVVLSYKLVADQAEQANGKSMVRPAESAER